jgi:hypothetical protein
LNREENMTKQHGRPSCDKRRAFLVQGATALGALAVGAGAGCETQQRKVSKAVAAYQGMPNGPQACGNCANFVPPAECRVVQGPVASNGWSRYWQPRRA